MTEFLRNTSGALWLHFSSFVIQIISPVDQFYQKVDFTKAEIHATYRSIPLKTV